MKTFFPTTVSIRTTDLEACGYLSDSDGLPSVRTWTSTRSWDAEEDENGSTEFIENNPEISDGRFDCNWTVRRKRCDQQQNSNEKRYFFINNDLFLIFFFYIFLKLFIQTIIIYILNCLESTYF